MFSFVYIQSFPLTNCFLKLTQTNFSNTAENQYLKQELCARNEHCKGVQFCFLSVPLIHLENFFQQINVFLNWD